MMLLFILILFQISLISCKTTEQQLIHIRIDEELPISTILFTTSNSITYRLFDTGRNHNSFVRYDSSTGQLTLARALDREQLCSQHLCSCNQCQLTIELIEWQLPYRLLQLILNIDDINDHVPGFSSKNYHFNVMENVPIGYEISLEQAQDADLSENGRINYELKRIGQSQDESPFELHIKNTGALTLKVRKEIDREQRDHYQYELIAFDHGQPRKHSSTKLDIHVDDLNDNSVMLTDTHIRLNISESTPVGTILTRVNATDADIGLNGKIHYSISHGLPSSSWMDVFRISETTGSLILAGPLDYESEQSYRLTVQVRDLGENSLAHFMTIDIYILDENDNRPQAYITFVEPLINQSRIILKENVPIGQILAHVSVSDGDSGLNGQMTYHIEKGNQFIGIKSIDQRSFLLVIENLIDRETLQSDVHPFVLIISDHGSPRKTLRLEYDIMILDENDSPPVFNSSFQCNLHLKISNNQSLEQPQYLFQVWATDRDSNENGRISYSILPPYDYHFRINENGQVYYSTILNQSAHFHVRILASDHGTPYRLNATHDCYISLTTSTFDDHVETSIDFSNQSFVNGSFNYSNKIFKWSLSLFDNYSLLVIGLFVLFLFTILTLITICITFCLHAIIFSGRKNFQKKQTYHCTRQYHLYDTIHRKSPFNHDDSGRSSTKLDDHDDVISEERERLVNSASDQTSCESSESMNRQIKIINQNSIKRPLSDHQHFSRTIRNSFPPSPYLSSMPSVVAPPPKPPRDLTYESSALLKVQTHSTSHGRPLSLSISTATTYASSATDSSSSPLPGPPSMNTFRPPFSSFKNYVPMRNPVRLAEEEKIDV